MLTEHNEVSTLSSQGSELLVAFRGEVESFWSLPVLHSL